MSRMIVDFHTHIFPPHFQGDREKLIHRDATFAALFSNPRPRLATAEDLVEAMDAAGVDIAVVMGVGWTDPDVARQANDYILESSHRFPGRLVGFCSVNPAWGEGAVMEVQRCAREGVRGVGELHPDSQGFDLGCKEALAPLMEAVEELGLVLLTHSSEPVGHAYPGKGRTTPEVLYAFVSSFPRNLIVCAHWGGGLPFYSFMPEVASTLENVYFDTAASPLLYGPDIIPTIVGLSRPGSVLFGTDFPLIGLSRTLKQVKEAPLPDDAMRGVLGDNARPLLGIPARES